MENYLKFLKRLPKSLRLKVIQAIEKISLSKTSKMDIKCLSKAHRLYRCRVGKIRILYQAREDGNYILDIGFRGDVYKNLNNY